MYLKHNEINMPYLLDLTYDIIHSTELEAKFAVTEKKAWQPFWLVVDGFLDIYNNKTYKELVEILLSSTAYCVVECLNVRFVCSHLDFCRSNWCDVSEYNGEIFHKQVEAMEKRQYSRWGLSSTTRVKWQTERHSLLYKVLDLSSCTINGLARIFLHFDMAVNCFGSHMCLQYEILHAVTNVQHT